MTRSKSTVARGFTVVELMVAITTGLIVAAGAYMLAKTSLDVFQQEARMNAAQFSNLMGMNRLAGDIKRAGYQTSPHAATDTINVCVNPTTAELSEMLTAIRVFEGGANATFGLPRPTFGPDSSVGDDDDYPLLDGVVTGFNNRFPDRIRLSGNYSVAETFHLGNVETANGKLAIQVDQLSVQRVFKDAQAGGPHICDIFWGGYPKIARLLDPGGKSRFLRVTSCSQTLGDDNYSQIIVTTDPIPSGGTCSADPSGGYLTPVNFIDYVPLNPTGVGDPTVYGLPASTSEIFNEDAALAGIIGSQTRLALIRRELDADGEPIPDSGEIVADYVADLNFSARVTSVTTPYTLSAAPFETLHNVPPQRIRALGIRLTTRARNPDRELGHDPAAPPTTEQPLQTFLVFDNTAVVRYRYARVRTLFTEVAIPNLTGATPW